MNFDPRDMDRRERDGFQSKRRVEQGPARRGRVVGSKIDRDGDTLGARLGQVVRSGKGTAALPRTKAVAGRTR